MEFSLAVTVLVDVSDRFHDCRVVELFRFRYWRVQCYVVICFMVGSEAACKRVCGRVKYPCYLLDELAHWPDLVLV